ncbi:MAG: transcriptional regulator, LuxR family [Betaproteobacteria bacterium]|nr:transcriptional regulator, LuxR family [Betaproteobacteria bacterium]
MQDQTGGVVANLDGSHLESIALTLEHSLAVRTRHQFFGWTQGSLQSLIAHELLICVLRRDRPAPMLVDSFSTLAASTAETIEHFRHNVSLLAHGIVAWEENDYRPVARAAGISDPFASSPLGHELQRLGATHTVMHGTHDASGQWRSLFIFAVQPAAAGPQLKCCIELAVPCMHAAWMRTLFKRRTADAAAAHKAAPLLTERQQEILEWVYRGKSNADIASILKLSPFTIKNHVQRILRRLNTTNRAHAVGKALAFRALDF